MKKYHVLRASVFGAAVFVALGLSPARATVFTDFTFDGDPLGSAPPTTYPAVDPYPQQNVYAIGGFPDTGPVTGTATVQNVGTMFHALEMTTTQGGTGALWVDTQFITVGNKAVVSFDLNVEATPLTGIPQAVTGATNGQAFVIQAFASTADRAFRWVVTPTSAGGGDFGLRNPGAAGDLTVVGSYSNNTVYHVELDLDFGAQTLDAFLDNASIATNFPFVEPASNLAELFIFQNGVEGETNKVAFDNLITTATVPEPASVLLFGGGILGVGAWRKRPRKNARLTRPA